eukprot:jgi/Psemu1/1847/gm1.1847_g
MHLNFFNQPPTHPFVPSIASLDTPDFHNTLPVRSPTASSRPGCTSNIPYAQPLVCYNTRSNIPANGTLSTLPTEPLLPAHHKDQLTKPSTIALTPVPYTSTPVNLALLQLTSFGSTLHPSVQGVLHNSHGKPHPNLLFIPVLSASDTTAWLCAFAPACLYASTLHAKYYPLDSTPAKGFTSYHQFQMETSSINKDRMRCSSAALLHYQMNVPCLVCYLGSPHLAAYRNIPEMLCRLHLGCSQPTANKVRRIFTTSPRLFAMAFPPTKTSSVTTTKLVCWVRYNFAPRATLTYTY